MDKRYRYGKWAGLLAMALMLSATGYRLLQPSPQPANDALPSDRPWAAVIMRAINALMHTRPLQFPADHGPHPEFRNEWWYLTGNLTDAVGRPIRLPVDPVPHRPVPTPPVADSAWRTNQVYMGHFALTDVAGETGITGLRAFQPGRSGFGWARKQHHFASGWKIGR
jgi:predicted secreted hydrolase